MIDIVAAILAVLGAVLALLLLRSRDARKTRLSHEVARGDLLDRIPALVWTMHPDGTAEFFNEAWTAFTGLSAAELLRSGITNAIHPEDRGPFFSTWRDALSGDRSRDVEIRLRDVSGIQYRWHLARAYPIHEGGRIVRWIGTATDIHERRAAYERSQEVADRLQEALAPGSLPSTQNVVLDATFVPAGDIAHVGGDWYDALAIDERTIFFALGDVSGHGLEAAVTMSRVRQLIIGTAMAERDPAEVLRLVNRALALQEPTIVTAVVGLVDTYSFVLRYATAGHPAPILVAPDGPASLLEHFGMPLNVEPELKTRTYECQLHPGSLLVLYTDGLTEHSHDIFSGERRLLLAARAANDPKTCNPSEAIRREIFGSERGRDDVAVLTIKFGGAPTLQTLAQDAASALTTAATRTRVPKTRERAGTTGHYGHHLGGDSTLGKPIVRRRA